MVVVVFSNSEEFEEIRTVGPFDNVPHYDPKSADSFLQSKGFRKDGKHYFRYESTTCDYKYAIMSAVRAPNLDQII
jgi:hypothetical protein